MKGQTLIEALVALAVAVSIVSAITIVAINSLNNVEFSKNQNSATQYAAEGMEIVRKIRNKNWADFYAKTNVRYCLPKNASDVIPGTTGIPACPVNIDAIFKRQVLINHDAPDCSNTSKVTVTVFWSDSKCTAGSNLYCHKTELISCFSNYSIIPTP